MALIPKYGDYFQWQETHYWCVVDDGPANASYTRVYVRRNIRETRRYTRCPTQSLILSSIITLQGA